MMDLITAVTQSPDSQSLYFFSLNFRVFLCACLSFCLLPLSAPPPQTCLHCDGQENMLTCYPSSLLIKTFVVMGVAAGTGQQGLVSAVLSWGMANGCHGLVWALHDCFSSSEIHMPLTLGDSVACSARNICHKEEGMEEDLCIVCQVRGSAEGRSYTCTYACECTNRIQIK